MTTWYEDLLPMFPDTCTIQAAAAMDAYGKRTYTGAAVTVRCRYEPTDRVIRDATNREIQLSANLYLYGTDVSVTTDSRIVLPDSSIAKIAGIARHRDETGASHVVVQIGT